MGFREVKCEACDETVGGHGFGAVYQALVDHIKEKHLEPDN